MENDDQKHSEKIATLIEQNKWIIRTLAKIESEVHLLNNFRMKMVGGGIVAGVVGSLALDVVKRIFSA